MPLSQRSAGTDRSAEILDQLHRSLAAADVRREPYSHWLLSDVLPEPAVAEVLALPFAPPRIEDTAGRRETNNSTRVFFSPENRTRFPVTDALSEAFQSAANAGLFNAVCGTRLAGSYLRIEYCQDTDGFWLEPHTDISVKLFTMLIYLSTDRHAKDWGTDVYDESLTLVSRAPGDYNKGLIFIPAGDTWHGFSRRPIQGVRRSLIINYVTSDWRARHELAYPDAPIR